VSSDFVAAGGIGANLCFATLCLRFTEQDDEVLKFNCAIFSTKCVAVLDSALASKTRPVSTLAAGI